MILSFFAVPLKRKRKSPRKLIPVSEDSESDVHGLDDFASTSSKPLLKTRSHSKQAQQSSPRGRKQRLRQDPDISPSMKKPSRKIGQKLSPAGKPHCSRAGCSSSKNVLKSSTQQPQETTVKGMHALFAFLLWQLTTCLHIQCCHTTWCTCIAISHSSFKTFLDTIPLWFS